VYALMADETKDISGNEQMSVVLRFASRLTTATSSAQDVLQERFLGFVRLHHFDANSLAEELIQFLRRYQIEPIQCICQCYDGYVVNKLILLKGSLKS
jgi:hypothetical protein